MLLRWLFLSLLTIGFDLKNGMADWRDVIGDKLDGSDFTGGCRWNLGDKLVGEDFAQIIILSQRSRHPKPTSLTVSPTFTNHSLIVASFVPSPRSGSMILMFAKYLAIRAYLSDFDQVIGSLHF
jgi:hypothetical protein